MAKKSIVEREKKREIFAKKYSVLRKFLKGKIKSSSSFEEKLFYNSQLQKLPRNSSFSRLV
jgi:small subunit ribosomal protein S14